KSSLGLLAAGYDSLVMAIIRPPRCVYKVEDLGPTRASISGGLMILRRDFSVVNRRGLTLHGSQWRPAFVDNTSQLPCVVCLHGNSSARIDVVRTRSLALLSGLGCSVVAFDFSGSGLSQGEFVTLGANEHHDVADVLAHLRREGWAPPRVTLWGRSMGAASALLYTAAYGDDMISGLVLDSPFASFQRLAADLVKMGQVTVPKLAVKAALALIRRSVKKRARCDVRDLSPLAGVGSITVPALFVAAHADKVVPHCHGELLSAAYSGPHHLLSCSGGHNSARPAAVQEAIRVFLRASFRYHSHPAGPAGGAAAMAEVFAAIGRLEEAAMTPRGARSVAHLLADAGGGGGGKVKGGS
ncbi:unnamed protein product, partial [Phaeothamnion confervicola]